LHNVNARLLLVEESDSLPRSPPASTSNRTRASTASTPTSRPPAYQRHREAHGVDYTLYASKLFKSLPTPLLINAGLRATKAAHIGLLGFTDSYHVVAEANAVLFLPGNFALAAEYRQKPNDYTPIGTLVQREDDWWTLDAAYVVNSHLTLAVGYGHFGAVLNHKANSVWGVTTKYEF
jgi:hypothetical protein